MTSKGKDMDEVGQKLLLEDLQSPCTEEVAVFNAFSGLVREAARQFVVLDTAPTGHTLLLLDQTGAYHKEVKRNSTIGKITTPFMRLQDPLYSKMIIVTLAENTPVLEAAQLQADLRRAGIEAYGWIINKTFCNTGTTDPVLQQRVKAELKQIAQVENIYTKKYFVVPFTPNEPVGVENLQALIHTSSDIV
jgi:arsenite-transporting ATPase